MNDWNGGFWVTCWRAFRANQVATWGCLRSITCAIGNVNSNGHSSQQRFLLLCELKVDVTALRANRWTETLLDFERCRRPNIVAGHVRLPLYRALLQSTANDLGTRVL